MSSLCFAVAALVPLSAAVRAGSDARRTAVVEAVEKVQRCVVSISSEKLASSTQSLAVFAGRESRRRWSTEWGAAFSSTAAAIS